MELIHREDQPDQPGDRLPRAAVDGGGRHRAQGRFRRGPLPLRALLPSPAALSPHLQDLQPVVGVPQLGHRGADRGGGGRAQLLGAPERAADLRHVRGMPHGPAGAVRAGDDRTALRARRAAHRDRDRAQRPRVLLARGRDDPQRPRPDGVPEAGGGRARAPLHAREALPEAARAGPAARVAARRSCSSRAPPTASSRRARSRSRAAAWTTGRR